MSWNKVSGCDGRMMVEITWPSHFVSNTQNTVRLLGLLSSISHGSSSFNRNGVSAKLTFPRSLFTPTPNLFIDNLHNQMRMVKWSIKFMNCHSNKSWSELLQRETQERIKKTNMIQRRLTWTRPFICMIYHNHPWICPREMGTIRSESAIIIRIPTSI